MRIQLSDDGRGIKLENIQKRAKELGLLTDADSTQEISSAWDLVFMPGFSTGKSVSDLSGRGVGLDAVKKTIQKMGGKISINSRPGVGTTFVMDLPLTLAILQALLIEVRGCLVAIPAFRVQRVCFVSEDQFCANKGHQTVSIGGNNIPWIDLLQSLEGGEPIVASKEIVLIRHSRPLTVALGVDRVAGHREMVLKPAGKLMAKLGPFGGSGVLGDGRPVLVLDVDALLEKDIGEIVSV